MKYLKLATITTALVLSSNVNASVISTINDVDYEWLELTETAGLSRYEVEERLNDPIDVLFGYHYASRSQLQDLLLSYASWDGVDGIHGDPIVVAGIEELMNGIGFTFLDPGDGSNTSVSTTDGYVVE